MFVVDGSAAPSRPRAGASGAALTTGPLQLQWAPQAQFAGYFAADEQGYYAAEGLDVDLVPGGPDVVPQTVGSDPNGPEFTIAWVPKVLEVRVDKGQSDLVDIAQVFQRSGTARRSRGRTPNITIARGLQGQEGRRLGLRQRVRGHGRRARKAGLTQGTDYTKVIQPFDMTLLLTKQIDVAEAMIYNEYAQVLEATNPATGKLVPADDLNVINYNDVGTAMLQDAIWARAAWLAEPGNEDIATKFLTRVVRGLDVLPRQPGRVRPVHDRRGLDARRRPPGLDDERDQLR